MENRFADFLTDYREQLISAGKELDKKELPRLTEELFSEYARTGKRLNYENAYFMRRRFLTVYAMLSVLYGNRSDISRLETVIDAICTEECWALPAHVDTGERGWRETVDLFAAETAFSLAEIIRLLEDKLSASVREKARGEVFRRVLDPFMRSRSPCAWWETADMNWCAVCCGSIGAAAIWLMESGGRELDGLLNRINSSILNYLDGFSDDGACLEGLGYCTYGMSFFTAYADLLYRYSGGKTDLFENARLKNIALFPQKCCLPGGVTVSFSDSRQDEKLRTGLAAYLAKQYPGVEFPDPALAAGLESDPCCRYVVISRDYFWAERYAGTGNVSREWHTVLPDAQWSVCRSDNGCAIAAKGGHNNEPHNHNDVGSFLYVCDGEVILDDLGAGEYTRDYFGENRYTNLCCRSLGHNVPLIDGREQCAGAEYRAVGFFSDGRGMTRMDIEAAYGLEDGEKITRQLLFDKTSGVCTVTDSFSLREHRMVTENLITSHRPVLEGSGFWIETGKRRFRIEITNGRAFAIREKTYADHHGVLKKVWLMQWTAAGERTEMAIGQSGVDSPAPQQPQFSGSAPSSTGCSSSSRGIQGRKVFQ